MCSGPRFFIAIGDYFFLRGKIFLPGAGEEMAYHFYGISENKAKPILEEKKKMKNGIKLHSLKMHST